MKGLRINVPPSTHFPLQCQVAIVAVSNQMFLKAWTTVPQLAGWAKDYVVFTEHVWILRQHHATSGITLPAGG